MLLLRLMTLLMLTSAIRLRCPSMLWAAAPAAVLSGASSGLLVGEEGMDQVAAPVMRSMSVSSSTLSLRFSIRLQRSRGDTKPLRCQLRTLLMLHAKEDGVLHCGATYARQPQLPLQLHVPIACCSVHAHPCVACSLLTCSRQ